MSNDTANDLLQQAQRNETPNLADSTDATDDGDGDGDGGDDGDGGGGGGLPAPNVSQRHLVAGAVVIAVLVALYLYSQRTPASTGAASGDAGDVEGEGEGDDGGLDLQQVEAQSGDTLEADRQVTNWMRESGRLSDHEGA